jgi:hypothetical protein
MSLTFAVLTHAVLFVAVAPPQYLFGTEPKQRSRLRRQANGKRLRSWSREPVALIGLVSSVHQCVMCRVTHRRQTITAIKESTESGANNGLGPLIDNVSLVPVAAAGTPTDTRSGDTSLPLPVRLRSQCGFSDQCSPHLCAQPSCVNMVANGSFEETTVAPNTWANFAPEQIPGWKSLNSERVELWGKDFMGVPAPHGQNILEIDYNSAKIDHLYQVRW